MTNWRGVAVMAMALVSTVAEAKKDEEPKVEAPKSEAKSEPGAVSGTFGKGVTMTSGDESVSLTIRARMQLRGSVFLPGDGDPTNDALDPISEMAVRRMRVTLNGYALSKDLTYNVQLAFSNQDTESDLRLPLRDAYFTWGGVRDANLRFGQMKVPFGRQRVTSSSSLQLVDRSITVAELNLDRDVGVQVFSKNLGGLDGKLGYALGFFGGDGRNRLGTNFGYLYSARVEVRPMGEFDDYVEADLDRRKKPALAIGASVAYNQATNRPRSTFDTPYVAATFDNLHIGADMMFKAHGLSLTGELLYRDATTDSSLDEESGTEEYSRNAYGWYAQAGQMLTKKVEIAGRFGQLTPIGDLDVNPVKYATEAGGGLSYYFHRHDLKVQGDYFYLPTASASDDNHMDDGTHQIRVQTQLWF